jgi:hypothetical protein
VIKIYLFSSIVRYVVPLPRLLNADSHLIFIFPTKRKMMFYKLIVLLFVVFISCAGPKNISQTQTSIFPATLDKPNNVLRQKRNFIFFFWLASQTWRAVEL